VIFPVASVALLAPVIEHVLGPPSAVNVPAGKLSAIVIPLDVMVPVSVPVNVRD
jgi:hypothetical protein